MRASPGSSSEAAAAPGPEAGPREFRPAYASAVLYPLGVGAAWLLGPLGLLGIGLASQGHPVAPVVLPLLALGAAGGALAFLQLRARWSKTLMRIEPGHLVFETGGLGTRSATQLAMANITHLGHELPIVESRVMGSGRLRVESAGSAGAEVDLAHLADPRAALGQVVHAMAEAGLEIESHDQLAEARPAMLGVGLGAAATFLGVLLFTGGAAATVTGILGEGGWSSLELVVVALLGLGALGLPGLLAALQLLDAREQRFLLMDRSVTFYGGLPERTTVIPMANIADSRVVQGLGDRLLGLSTVKISCQGAGNEITIQNLRDAPAFSKRLADHLKDLKKVAADRAFAASLLEEPPPGAEAAARPPRDRDRKFTGTYRMTLLKNLALPLAGLVAFGLGGLAFWSAVGIQSEGTKEVFTWLVIFTMISGGHLVKRGLEATCTRFEVGSDEITEHYRFVTTRTRTFSFDKVTSLRRQRGPLDRLMGTQTFRLASIGSSSEMELRALPWDPDLEALLLTKLGIQPQDPVLTLGSSWSPGECLRAQPAWLVLGALAILASLGLMAGGQALAGLVPLAAYLALLAPAWIYQALFYRTSHLHFLDHSVLFERGLFVRERTHVAYEDVKDLVATRYALSGAGRLKVDVAGETLAMPDGQSAEAQQEVPAWARQAHLSSNAFTVEFLPHVHEEAVFFDLLQIQRPGREAFPELRARAQAEGALPKLQECPVHLGRHGWWALLGALVFLAGLAAAVTEGMPVPLAGVLGGLALAALLVYRAYLGTLRYVLEEGAVARYEGLVYPTRASITFDQIDFVNVSQGILDRVFGTGSVQVHTTGSSRAEMVLGGFRDFEGFGARLKEAAQKVPGGRR